jgi:hypothetical protein
MMSEKARLAFAILGMAVGICVAAIGEYILITGLPAGQYPVLIFAVPVFVGAAVALAIGLLPLTPMVVARSVAMMGAVFSPLVTGWSPLGKRLSGKPLDWHETLELRSFAAALVGFITAVAGEYYVLTAYQQPRLMLAVPLVAAFVASMITYFIMEKIT